MMLTVERSVDVAAPPDACFARFADPGERRRFMAGVESVEEVAEGQQRWVARLGGPRHELDVAITESSPPDTLGWSSVSGPAHAGVATFAALPGGGTRVALRLDVDADSEGWAVSAAGDLERFARLVDGESHPAAQPAQPAQPVPVPVPQDPRGLIALDRHGEEVGVVVSVVPQPPSGPLTHLIVESPGDAGGLAALRTRRHAVTAAGAAYNAVWHAVDLPVSAQELRAAPAEPEARA